MAWRCCSPPCAGVCLFWCLSRQIGKAVLASSLSLDAPKHIFLMLFMLTDRLDPNSFFKVRRHLPPPSQELASWLTAWLMVCLWRGCGLTGCSFSHHQPYYELLPPTLSNMPIFWDEEELEFLHGSYLLTQIEERKVGRGTATPFARWLAMVEGADTGCVRGVRGGVACDRGGLCGHL